ncbi:MAG TPA: efflux RND transporter periplasmic adaptor subunit [Gemmataceae bacterium]|nr:efflux RND transporter periplasmic adaptor subunit [Gemmataceae bacterium]
MKKLLLTLVLLTLGLAGGAYWLSHKRPANGEDLFTFASVEFGSIAETVGGSGVLQPREVLAIFTEVPGRVVEINADFNDEVQSGDVLCRLDDRMARRKLAQAEVVVKQAAADLERAKAAREAAQVRVDRLSKLDPEIRVQKEFDEAQYLLKAAEAAVKAAEAKLEEANEAQRLAELGLKLMTIRVPVVERTPGSPEGGAPTQEKIDLDASAGAKRKYLVLDRKVVLNRMVSPQETSPLFTLAADLEEMQLHAQVAEGDVSKVHLGQLADFTVSAYSDTDLHFSGKVSEIRMMPTSELGAIFYKVIIAVRNQPDATAPGGWKLRPGMTTASLDIIRRKHDNTWKMPTSAINFQLDEHFLTEAARAKLARWEQRPDQDQWKPVWVLDAAKKPWPIFVRVGGKTTQGDTGIRDPQYYEVLDWDPELSPRPDPANPATYPRVIIEARTAQRSGLFGNMPNIKF